MKKFFGRFKKMFWLFAITFSLVVVSCAPSRYVAQQDSDNDGVPDVWDKCDLASGTWDNNGCPEPVKIVTLTATTSDVGAPLLRDLDIGGVGVFTEKDQNIVNKIWLLLEGRLSTGKLYLTGTEFDIWQDTLKLNHKKLAKIISKTFESFYQKKGHFPDIIITGTANFVAMSESNPITNKKIQNALRKIELKGEKEKTDYAYKLLSDWRAKNFFKEISENGFSNKNLTYCGNSFYDPSTIYDIENKSGSNRIIYLERKEYIDLLGSSK